jgi:hypothetical protein
MEDFLENWRISDDCSWTNVKGVGRAELHSHDSAFPASRVEGPRGRFSQPLPAIDTVSQAFGSTCHCDSAERLLYFLMRQLDV